MDVEFRNRRLLRYYTERGAAGKLPAQVAEAYVDVIDLLRAVDDLNALRVNKGMRLEKLEGPMREMHSIRLNRQWRLILQAGDDDAVVTVWDVNNHRYRR